MYNIFDFIDHPPSGQTYGVRSHKVALMPKSEYESRLITEDENSWGKSLSIDQRGCNQDD